MAVLVEGISVLVKRSEISARYPGGWEQFSADVPNQSLCADSELARVGFMMPEDVRAYISGLEACGLTYLRKGAAVDLVVADQQRGLTVRCDWAEFGHVETDDDPKRRISLCRVADNEEDVVICPPGWLFEGSLSQRFVLVPNEHHEKGLKYLGRKDGIDVYESALTGGKLYAGRTGPR